MSKKKAKKAKVRTLNTYWFVNWDGVEIIEAAGNLEAINKFSRRFNKGIIFSSDGSRATFEVE